jgi:hypothetical protein
MSLTVFSQANVDTKRVIDDVIIYQDDKDASAYYYVSYVLSFTRLLFIFDNLFRFQS